MCHKSGTIVLYDCCLRTFMSWIFKLFIRQNLFMWQQNNMKTKNRKISVNKNN